MSPPGNGGGRASCEQDPAARRRQTTNQHHPANGCESTAEGRQGDLDFAGPLNILEHSTFNEFTSVCWQDGQGFHSKVTSLRGAVEFAATLPQVCTWFGINPVRLQTIRGRGKAGDVTRLAALPADLDVKDTGCPTPDVALQIIADLSDILGTPPSALVETGHGYQPYWPVFYHEHTSPGVTLRRWGRLVAAVAARYGAKVDAVYDLPRVFRVPGTFNCKGLGGEAPIPVVAHRLAGRQLDLADVDDMLAAQGVRAEPGDTQTRKPVSNPEGWTYGLITCPYVGAILRAIPTDTPTAGRHQWMLSQCVKLVSAVRMGCLSRTDFERGADRLQDRLVALREETGEEVGDREVPAAMAHAVEIVAAKTDEEACAELGGHTHGRIRHSVGKKIREGTNV